jgi:Na+-driven multidrug efflux pump
VLARRKALILVGACDAAVVIASLTVLSPPLGATGAAIACIIGYTVSAIFGGIVVARILVADGRSR